MHGVVIPRSIAKQRGIKRYFNGIPCPQSHIAYRWTSTGICGVCVRDSDTRRRDDPDRERNRSQAWKDANRDRVNEYSRKYRSSFPSKVSSAMASWRSRNPEICRAHEQNRAARKRNASGKHTGAEIVALRAAQRGKCAICKKDLGKHHVDHIFPLSKGGTNDIYNIQLLCKKCNLTKHASDPIRFMQKLGFLL